MDIGSAINGFLLQVDRFDQLPLVSDEEVTQLLGVEVGAAVAELERFSQQRQLCSGCGGDCCCDIRCELYAAQFDRCPIHDYRPLACRLHFCHRFDDAGKSLIIGLRDIFFGCFRAVDFQDCANLRALDSPPLSAVAPGFVDAASPWVEAVRRGALAPEQAAKLIRREAEAYRSRHSTGRKDAGDALSR